MNDHVYPSADNAFSNVLFNIMHAPVVPSRVGDTRELVGVQVEIDSRHPFVTNQVRKFSPEYGAGEFMWYMSGAGIVEPIAHYAPSYRQFARPDGTAFGAYGARWSEFQQFTKLLNVLHSTPDSRQAVLVQWMPRDLDAASGAAHPEKDLPCTLTLQFLRREDKLHLIVTMRSNDAWLGMPNDWFCFMMLQHLVAGFIGCEVGRYIHQAGSLHLYEKDWDKARAAASQWGFEYPMVRFDPMLVSPRRAEEAISEAVIHEYGIREHNVQTPCYYQKVGPVFRMMLALCAMQNGGTVLSDAVPDVLQQLVLNRR